VRDILRSLIECTKQAREEEEKDFSGKGLSFPSTINGENDKRKKQQ